MEHSTAYDFTNEGKFPIHRDSYISRKLRENSLVYGRFTVGRTKSAGRSVVENRPRPTDFDRPRTLKSFQQNSILENLFFHQTKSKKCKKYNIGERHWCIKRTILGLDLLSFVLQHFVPQGNIFDNNNAYCPQSMLFLLFFSLRNIKIDQRV